MYAVFSRDGEIVPESNRFTRTDSINAFLRYMHEQLTWVYWSESQGFTCQAVVVIEESEIEEIGEGATVQ